MQKITGILSSEQINKVQSALQQAEFVDGKLTAGKAAGTVKHNLELSKDSEVKETLVQVLMHTIMQHSEFQSCTMPARISTPIIACYLPGMNYGLHVDDPLMGQGQQRYRSDVSFTLFLNEPDEYEGGSLTIQTSFGSQKVKLAAGDMVVYPSSSLHEVEPIIRGRRQVLVGWLQSMIRASDKREILFDLWQARENLLENQADSKLCQQVDLSYVNLVRMWSDP